MGKFRQAFNGTIKCKVESETMISAYEIARLQASPLDCLLQVEDCKGGELAWKGAFKATLASEISKGIHGGRLGDILRQVIQLQLDLLQMGLNGKKTVLTPEYIYTDSAAGKLKIIYYPVNGESISYDAALFVRDLILSAKLNGAERGAWDAWADVLQKTGDYRRALLSIPEGNPQKGAGDGGGRLEWEDEPPTSKEESKPTSVGFDWEEEPPTSADDGMNYAFENTNNKSPFMDDDGEALTDAADSLKMDMLDQDDGTFLDSLSERNSGEPLRQARVVRIATGQRIAVSKSIFVIGRSERKADYSIGDNPQISGSHATIIRKGNSYFFMDNHSSNGSTVDGRKVVPGGEPVPIYSGSIFILGKEKFRFEIE